MFKLADLQGNILRGYTKKPYVRYLVLEVADPGAARRWLAGAYRAATVFRRSRAGTGGQTGRTPVSTLA